MTPMAPSGVVIVTEALSSTPRPVMSVKLERTLAASSPRISWVR
jgi:hypothetical protein